MISNICNSRNITESISQQHSSGEYSKGNHAICYDHPTDKNKVLLATRCPARADMARNPKKYDSPYLPKLRKIATVKGTPVYEMERLYPISRHTKHNLSKIDKVIFEKMDWYGSYKVLNAINFPKHMSKMIKRTLSQVKRVSNSHVGLDGCGHNMMMTKSGKLILNDIIWVEESLLRNIKDPL